MRSNILLLILASSSGFTLAQSPPPTVDGSCGPDNGGFTCLHNPTGDYCCGSTGTCGSIPDFCGTGCNPDYGLCDDTLAAGANGTSSSTSSVAGAVVSSSSTGSVSSSFSAATTTTSLSSAAAGTTASASSSSTSASANSSSSWPTVSSTSTLWAGGVASISPGVNVSINGTALPSVTGNATVTVLPTGIFIGGAVAKGVLNGWGVLGLGVVLGVGVLVL